SSLLRRVDKAAGLNFYPPSQKATGVNPWTAVGQSLWRRTMNARWVTLRSLGEGGYASEDSAEVSGGATAVKPWGSTFLKMSQRHS
ncbi:MAG: hypothetical protein V3S85_04075, partial [Nitrospirales bacterium]